ncbi:hypothetical protein DNTS_012054, partial [Danionella cerebrum]
MRREAKLEDAVRWLRPQETVFKGKKEDEMPTLQFFSLKAAACSQLCFQLPFPAAAAAQTLSEQKLSAWDPEDNEMFETYADALWWGL